MTRSHTPAAPCRGRAASRLSRPRAATRAMTRYMRRRSPRQTRALPSRPGTNSAASTWPGAWARRRTAWARRGAEPQAAEADPRHPPPGRPRGRSLDRAARSPPPSRRTRSAGRNESRLDSRPPARARAAARRSSRVAVPGSSSWSIAAGRSPTTTPRRGPCGSRSSRSSTQSVFVFSSSSALRRAAKNGTSSRE